MDELHQGNSDVIVEEEVSMEVGEPEGQELEACIPSLDRSWEEWMDVDSGYDPNLPGDSNINEEHEDELLKEPKLVTPEGYSDDFVMLGVTPGDMDTL